jgi:hypothetical protein
VGRDLVDVARDEPWKLVSPAAIYYEMARGHVGHDVAAPVALDYERRYGPLARGDFGTFAHELYEDPVSFGLDALTVASLGAGTAARGAAATKAVRAGEGVWGAAKAARHGPRTELRRVKVPVEGRSEVDVLLGAYSRSALTRSTQKFLDGIRERFPNAPILGRSLYRKVGFQQVRLGEIEERLGRAGAEELLAVAGGRKLTAAEHRALRVQAEGVPIDKRIAKHRADILTADSRDQVRRLRREIRLLERARKYVDESGKLTDPKLQDVYGKHVASTTRREDLLALVDELAPERAAARVQRPAQVFAGVEGRERFSELEQTLEKELRPLVDELFTPGVRKREQVMRNVLPYTKGKRARAGLEREIEMTGIPGSSSSVLANAYEFVESKLLDMAKRENADPRVTRVATMIEERERLRAALTDPDVIFGPPPPAAGSPTDLAFLEKRLAKLEDDARVSDLRRTAAAAPEEVDALRLAHEEVLREIDTVRRQIADARAFSTERSSLADRRLEKPSSPIRRGRARRRSRGSAPAGRSGTRAHRSGRRSRARPSGRDGSRGARRSSRPRPSSRHGASRRSSGTASASRSSASRSRPKARTWRSSSTSSRASRYPRTCARS